MTQQGGFGLVAKIYITSALTAITNVLDGSEMPELEKYLVDMTSHSASGGYKVWVDSGKKSLNSFKLVLGWDPDDTTHQAILTAFASPTAVQMEIVAPNSADTMTFYAHIQKVGRVTKQEGGYQCDVTIQPTGAPS